MPTGKWNACGFWTADEDAALDKGVNEHGLDFDRNKAEAGACFGYRTAQALQEKFREGHPETFRKLRESNGIKARYINNIPWTEEEEEDVKRGVEKHGNDWEKTLKTESEALGDRTASAVESRYTKKLKIK